MALRKHVLTIAVATIERDAIKECANASGLEVSELLYRGLITLGWIKGPPATKVGA